ncbi:MAG TPA: hypothetical protein P5243_09800 [Bacteroidales bacterium]|jgi:hypothetical protein|nr:hypothetical protein [Bacteroidales bacterium]HRS19786.1 hypothetical protein [Bacteroidales bacterium]
MKYLLIILFICCLQHNSNAQIQGNSASIPEQTNSTDPLSTITVSVYWVQDSLPYTISCYRVQGKDAIMLKTSKFRGYTIDFHRNMAKSMFKQTLESPETEISIKTIFEGKYYLDVIDPQGIKVKTFLIEKKF